MDDFRQADLEPGLMALGHYALKLTLTPASMGPKDVDVLRDCGYSDEQILAANLVASYFNFINRLADGLGVDLEEWMTDLPRPSPFEAQEG
jgi:alkylhydroperoxidase family enzyme